ncbi:YceI family protein [Fulvivirgaceae bacterium BMA12]|uniref:YceI family protein n=1 Tax=Agaribacillus aureus TaxID=3051825 RepID=A0ABT8L999_9BACT|nr:YceI family protein [Fulvivirgaceae bacterium BMA12]
MASGIISFFCVWLFLTPQKDTIYMTKSGNASFKSEAPLELIIGFSNSLAGVINADKHTFAFTIPINSFDGFNSALQKEHFRENYMETHKYPNATFHGKMIEIIDLEKKGDYQVRAKGNLEIHGIVQERIIKCQLAINGQGIKVSTQFEVFLQDHDIQVPKVVYQKIAEEIIVSVDAEFVKR